jgi:hypothetical protein
VGLGRDLSLQIHEHRALTDGNRHPLYPALLAPFASRDHSFFATAKLLTFGLGMVGYLFVAWRVARRWGTWIAFLVLLACGSSFVWTASGLRCEVLLIPLLWVFWECGAAGFERPRLWLVAGCAAGLCYLTKANGTLLVIALVASWLFSGQPFDRRRWKLLLFLVPFALIVSPLVAWNIHRYGEPFYNFNSKHVMWLDSWEQASRAGTPLPTMHSWFADHGLGDLVAREFWGVLRLPDLWLFALFILAAISLATRYRGQPRGATCSSSRHELILATAIVAIHAVLLAWYTPIVASSRFVIPMQAVMWVIVFLAIARQIPPAWAAGMGRLRGPLTALVAIALVCSPLFLDFPDPYADPVVTYPEIEDWIRSSDETSMVYGPSENFPQWIFIPDFRFISVPPDLSFDELLESMDQRRTRVLLIDREMLRNRSVLGRLVVDRPGEGLVPMDVSSPLRVEKQDAETPRRWILYRLESPSS